MVECDWMKQAGLRRNGCQACVDVRNSRMSCKGDEEESMTNQHKVSSWCSWQWMFGNKRTSEETLFRCSESIPSDWWVKNGSRCCVKVCRVVKKNQWRINTRFCPGVADSGCSEIKELLKKHCFAVQNRFQVIDESRMGVGVWVRKGCGLHALFVLQLGEDTPRGTRGNAVDALTDRYLQNKLNGFLVVVIDIFRSLSRSCL